MDKADFSLLEKQFQKLSSQYHELSNRVAVLEGSRVSFTETIEETTIVEDQYSESEPGISATQFMFLLGRGILILAGGFLLRALTESGTIGPLVGFALGMVYSLGMIILAFRIFRGEDRIGATSLGLTAVLVAFPFLTESITQMHLVSAQTGGLSMGLVTAAGLWVAWYHRARFLAWAYCISSLIALVVLGFTAGAPIFFALLLLLLGMATLFLAYTRHWHLKRWLVAGVTNAVFLRLTIMATSGGLDSANNPVSAPMMLALDLALIVVYLGVFCTRALVWGKGVKVFDVVQSFFALGFGFGGAIHIATNSGHWLNFLGWTALLAALAFYSIAFTVVRSRLGRGRGFFYFASLALVFLVLGSQVVAHGSWLSWSWLSLGLLMAILGSRFDRVTLRAHSVVYLVLASFHTGLLTSTMGSFVGSAGSPWLPLGLAGVVNLAVVLVCYSLFIFRRGHERDSKPRRAPGFFTAILSLMGLGYLAIVFFTRVLTATPPDADPAILAVIRTAILSVTSVLLAFACRSSRFRELAWLVYPLLGLGCLKILLEDMRQGNPLTHFVAFGFLGVALIIAPRLLISGGKKREE